MSACWEGLTLVKLLDPQLGLNLVGAPEPLGTRNTLHMQGCCEA